MRSCLVFRLGAALVCGAALLALPARARAQARAQQADARTPALLVRRATGDSVVLDAAELARLPRRERQGTEHGRRARFAGVELRDVLRAAGVRVDSLRGPALTHVVLVEAADGYRVAFTLGELAADLGARDVLVADHRDGAPLADGEGPWRLVIPADRRAARWVRQLRAVTIVPLGRAGAGTGATTHGAHAPAAPR